MRTRLLSEESGRRSLVVVFDTGEEVASGLERVAREQRLAASHFTAIGALSSVALGYWNPDTRGYERNELSEQVEVLMLAGNIATGPDGAPRVHAHLVVGRRDGQAYGGHLLEGRVRPTLEVMLVESPAHLRRATDAATGLALLVP